MIFLVTTYNVCILTLNIKQFTITLHYNICPMIRYYTMGMKDLNNTLLSTERPPGELSPITVVLLAIL